MENITRKLLRPVIRRAAANMPEPDGSSLRESLRDKAFAKAFEGKAENLTVALLRARRDTPAEQFEGEAKELIDFSLSRPEWTLLDGFLGGAQRSSIAGLLIEKGLPPARVELIQKLLKQKLRMTAPEQFKSPVASAVAAAAQTPAQGGLWSRLSSRIGKE